MVGPGEAVNAPKPLIWNEDGAFVHVVPARGTRAGAARARGRSEKTEKKRIVAFMVEDLEISRYGWLVDMPGGILRRIDQKME